MAESERRGRGTDYSRLPRSIRSCGRIVHGGAKTRTLPPFATRSANKSSGSAVSSRSKKLIDLTILLRPPPPRSESAQQQRMASAIARAAVETEDMMAQRRFQLRRVVGKTVMSCSQELAVYAEKLGQVADKLADLDPLASPLRAFQELYEVPQPTQPHGCQPFINERLLKLASAMGSKAAVSSLQEVYPRGMSAERALRLGVRALSGLLTGEAETDAARRSHCQG